MAANVEWSWDYIAPNSTVSLFIHGYSDREAIAYSATVSGLFAPGVINPLGHIILTQGETYRHVDHTTARKVYIQNMAPFNPCACDLLILRESF